MRVGREMRRLCGELVSELTLPAPARPDELYDALCSAMSRRRGRPVLFRTAAFPPGTASGLWLDLADRDLVVVEQRTAPDHQLVILGHELWHMAAGHRVAARTRRDLADEREAESFGLLLASRCRTWLTGSPPRGPVARDGVAGRIEASLGYPGPQA